MNVNNLIGQEPSAAVEPKSKGARNEGDASTTEDQSFSDLLDDAGPKAPTSKSQLGANARANSNSDSDEKCVADLALAACAQAMHAQNLAHPVAMPILQPNTNGEVIGEPTT